MYKYDEITKFYTALMSGVPSTVSYMNDAISKSAAIVSETTAVAIKAAKESAEINNKWSSDTINRTRELLNVKGDFDGATKSLQNYATASTMGAIECISAQAETVKKAQIESVSAVFSTQK